MAEHKKQIGRDLPISICGALAKLAKPKPEKKPEQQSGDTNDDHVTNRAPQSDDTDDLASDEKAIRWAEQMFLRCRADCKEEDLDLKRCFTELVKLLANEIGAPQSTENRKVPDTAPPTEETVKRRGRPPGVKNKPKEPPTPGEKHATAVQEQADEVATKLPKSWDLPGNGVDPDASAEEMKAKFDQEAPNTAPAPAAAASGDDDLDVRKQPFYRPPTNAGLPEDERDQQDGRAA
jgi:hypothetical protein